MKSCYAFIARAISKLGVTVRPKLGSSGIHNAIYSHLFTDACVLRISMAINVSVERLVRSLVALALITAVVGCDTAGQSPSAADGGQGGSLSRFAVSGDHLYVIAGNSVKLFDISVPDNMAPWAQFFVDFDIETLHIYADKLFIGGRRGVYIYDNADPKSPQYLSKFLHSYACDPVVVQGDYAYVTLRSNGRGCQRMANNTLDVLDIKDIAHPQLVESILMYEPSGLAVDGTHLFVCDGEAGLKRFDITNPALPMIAQTWAKEQCNDVIAVSGRLTSVGKAGIGQWDYYSNPIQLLGTLAVEVK